MKKLLLILFVSLFLIGIVSASWDDSLTNGLIHYWNFNETAGTNTEDIRGIELGNQLNATLYNEATFGVGKFGNGLVLDGTGDYAEVDDYIGEPNNTNDFSVSFWVKRDLGDGSLTMFSDNIQMTTNGSWGMDSGGVNFDGYIGVTTKSGGAIVKEGGNFGHIVFVRNSTSYAIYMNGTLGGTGIGTGFINVTQLHFGCTNLGSICLDGVIDEFGIWNRDLSPNEVSDLWNGGAGIFYNVSILEASINLNLSYPLNNTKISSTSINFISNWTYTNMNKTTNATFFIYNSDGSIFNKTTLTISSAQNGSVLNMTNFSLGFVYKWNVYACGINLTDGIICSWGENGNFTFISSAFIETSVSYNKSLFEMKKQNLIQVINGNPSISSASANLWYNGTKYGSTVTDGVAGVYTASNLIDIPLQENIGGTGNKTFFWEWIFTLTGGDTINQNSTIYSHKVNRTYLVYCNALYNISFINFTTRNAINPYPKINATFKSSWSYGFNSDGLKRSTSYENVSETRNNWTFCMYPSYETYYTSASIEYDANGYAQNFYYLDNAILTNTSNAIDLYLLNDTLATVTELQVVDNAQNPKPNITIQIQLYDVGTDTYYTVAMAKTSFNGKDIVYLNWYSTLYKFIFTQNGTVLKVTDPFKISSTPQTFTIADTITYSFEKFRDFVYSLYYNDVTQNFILTFTKPSGLVDQGCLRVTKRTANNDTEICLTCETSSSATLYCNIGEHGNGTYIATFYATGSWYLLDWITEKIGGTFAETIYDLLGNDDATAYAFLFSGVVVAMFFISPVLAIVGLILGILGGAALGFTILNYTAFIGIVIVAGVIIWFIKR